jgi:hypothetical protein
MGVDVMKPAFNLKCKYRVTMLTREEWTREQATPVRLTDGSRTTEGTGAGWSLWKIFWKKAQDLSRKDATVFQAEVYAILACAYEIQTNDRPEKYVSICSDSQ